MEKIQIAEYENIGIVQRDCLYTNTYLFFRSKKTKLNKMNKISIHLCGAISNVKIYINPYCESLKMPSFFCFINVLSIRIRREK